ncbi:acetate uptake transporter [Microvirga sp. W0021]|uniref:Acetate uptake transporter n=1 Tax=Hohaiivirga grylli TaxID=3133970 RepID=A0ABV0BIP7_9HYPH
MTNETNKKANPAPLGLMGFGMTTVLLNIHNAGFFPVSAMIISMGLFYGGAAQVIAGIMSYRNGDTFGTTSFTSYGFFWLTLCFIWMLPSMGATGVTESAFMGIYLAMWGVFTFFLFIGTLKYPIAKQVVFGSLVILFALLAAHNLTGNHMIGIIAGYEGIFCGASAIYFAMALVLNETFGRTILPVGELSSASKASAVGKVSIA